MSKLTDEARQSLQNLLTEAAEVEDLYAKIPDGDYGCEIDSVQLTVTKETKQPMLSWTFRIIEEDSEFSNRLIFKNSVLNTPQNTKRAMMDLEKFGIDTTTVESISKALPDLEHEVVIVQLTTGRRGDGQWVNILIE